MWGSLAEGIFSNFFFSVVVFFPSEDQVGSISLLLYPSVLGTLKLLKKMGRVLSRCSTVTHMYECHPILFPLIPSLTCSESLRENKTKPWDFPGSPVVKTPYILCRGHGFDPWLCELRSHILFGQKKKKNCLKIINPDSHWRLIVSPHNKFWGAQPGVLQSIGLQKVRLDWVTELNWW